MKQLLAYPGIYQLYQEAGGFFGARIIAIREYLEIAPGARVVDIGCGPGHIVKHLPEGVDYIGLDIDEPSIAFAQKHFGHRGRFEARFFDAQAAAEMGPVDIVMMNGVMHHIGDVDLCATLENVKRALKPGGVLFTLDGCYAEGQSGIAKWLLDNDRGEHVREADGYTAILQGAFDDVQMHIRDDVSRLPYTFAIGVARNHG